MRKTLDDTIEFALSKSGYQELRNQYKSLKTIEGDVLRSAAKHTISGEGTLGDKLLNTFAGEELVRGIMTLNPQTITNAASLKSFQLIRSIMRNPDRKIANIFKMVGKLPRK